MPYPTYQTRDLDNIRKLKHEAVELRAHANIKRVRLTETLSELMQYIEQNIANDRLIHPEKENPFKPRKPCQIL